MQGLDNWIGIECEGRYFGIKTYFIRHKIGSIPTAIQHLYFTNEWWLTSEPISTIEALIKEGYLISIETTKETYQYLTPNLKVWCHIIYRIDDDFPHDLKETDSIFIDKDKYNVLCFNKYQAYKVTPIDYSKDII